MAFLRVLGLSTVVGALVIAGCAGKAVDDPGGDGDGDSDSDVLAPPPDDAPLSDENFQEALDDRIVEYCRNLIDCGVFDGLSDCTSVIVVGRAYDLDSIRCRELALDVFDCTNGTWVRDSCSAGSTECVDLSLQFDEECVRYEYAD